MKLDNNYDIKSIMEEIEQGVIIGMKRTLWSHKEDEKAEGSLSPENVQKYQNKANELKKQIESSRMDLTDEEQHAINQYISLKSYVINEALRDGLDLTEYQKEMIKTWTQRWINLGITKEMLHVQ